MRFTAHYTAALYAPHARSRLPSRARSPPFILFLLVRDRPVTGLRSTTGLRSCSMRYAGYRSRRSGRRRCLLERAVDRFFPQEIRANATLNHRFALPEARWTFELFRSPRKARLLNKQATHTRHGRSRDLNVGAVARNNLMSR